MAQGAASFRWEKAITHLKNHDVGDAAIGKLLALAMGKKATTMLHKVVESSDLLRNSLGDLGFTHYSALQKLVEADKDVVSLRDGTADADTRARVCEAFRQSAIADPLKRSKKAQWKHSWLRRQLKVIEDRDIIIMPNGDQFHFMYVCTACYNVRIPLLSPDGIPYTKEQLTQCNLIMSSGLWEEVYYDPETMEGEGGWRCLVSYWKIEVRASAECQVCSTILSDIAKANATTDANGVKKPNYDVTTWPPIGCGAPFRNKTKSGKKRMCCIVRVKHGDDDMHIPSILPPPDVLHALNICMSLPKDWRKQSPRMLKMQNIPVFPTTWNCGWPHEFVGRFQVEDWMKRGMPYMTEEGWSTFLLMVVATLSTDLTAEQTLEREAVIETARTVTAIWEEMQAQGDETTASSGPPGLYIEHFDTAEERRKIKFTDEASRKRD